MFRRGKYCVNKQIAKMIPWDDIKSQYSKDKYLYLDPTTSTRKECKNADIKNAKEYRKRADSATVLLELNHELTIAHPPRPTNIERHDMYERWAEKKPAVEIALASVELYKVYQQIPCRDYSPDKAVETLEKLIQNKISSSTSTLPSAPPTVPGYYEYPEIDMTETKDI
jgi:hypothetical protein